jgi:hypothetical protein
MNATLISSVPLASVLFTCHTVRYHTMRFWTPGTPTQACFTKAGGKCERDGTHECAGRVYVIGGGADGLPPLSSTLSCDPLQSPLVWTAGPSLVQARGNIEAVVYNGYLRSACAHMHITAGSIIVAGGGDASNSPTGSTEKFNGTIWTSGPSMNSAREGAALVVWNCK